MKFVKYFRQHQKKAIHGQVSKDVDQANSTIIGMAYSDLVSKRVIICVILLLVIVPLLERTVDDLSISYSLSLLTDIYLKSNMTVALPMMNIAASTVYNAVGVPLLLNVSGRKRRYTTLTNLVL
jgi:hypothetical protein